MWCRQSALVMVLVLAALTGCSQESKLELLNVSYDPTRELYREINTHFVAAQEKATGEKITVQQSHGGSGSQARAIIDGLEGDVVTLALPSDTEQLVGKGLIQSGWRERLPNQSLPYVSTIVFVVRQGNPKNIRDWPDLVQPGVQIITPNPKTSGNGQLSFLAAWASVVQRGGTAAQATEFVTKLYQQVPVLDQGARGSTTTFAQKKIGDVHLTWENEAYLEVAEAQGTLEIVTPPISILAEPAVAVVDANVERKKTRAVAEAYLNFLYTPAAQEIIARHHYRPSDPEVLKKHQASFPPLQLVPITNLLPGGWGEARQRFFNDGGVFDAIYQRKRG